MRSFYSKFIVYGTNCFLCVCILLFCISFLLVALLISIFTLNVGRKRFSTPICVLAYLTAIHWIPSYNYVTPLIAVSPVITCKVSSCHPLLPLKLVGIYIKHLCWCLVILKFAILNCFNKTGFLYLHSK